MCKYEYINRSNKLKATEFCIYPKFYQELKATESLDLSDFDNSLPIDEDGYCIFHSKNTEWKKENNFEKKFIDLLKILNQQALNRRTNKEIRGKFDFSGFIFIKSREKDGIIFEGLHFLEAANFLDSIFTDSLVLNNLIFENGCDFENAVFENDITISNTNFLDTTLFQKTVFEGNFLCINSVFKTFTLFTKAIFKKDFSLRKGCTFGRFVQLDDVCFGNKSSIILFENITFNEWATVDFSNSNFEGLVEFRDVKFNDNVNFINCSFNLLNNTNPLNCSVTFKNIQIGNDAKIQFKGTEPYFNMFKNDVSFDFNENLLGLVSFINIDFESVDKKSEKLLLRLKEDGLVQIGNGCYKNKFNKVSIFIASQEILKSEREFIETEIRKKNPHLEAQYISLQPIRWEKRDKGNVGTRKQDEYNNLIIDSEVFILILWNSVGKYSEEEFDCAYTNLKKGNNPKRIYIFNKLEETDNQEIKVDETFPIFLEKLAKQEMFIINFSNNLEMSTELNYMFDEIEKRYSNR